MATETVKALSAEEISELCLRHTLYDWSAQAALKPMAIASDARSVRLRARVTVAMTARLPGREHPSRGARATGAMRLAPCCSGMAPIGDGYQGSAVAS